jgi:putative transposase
MSLLNYKFRLYPTKEQELALEQTLDGCRWVYNYFLSIPKMSEYDMNYALTELKEQHPWLRNYHSKMLQMVCKQVSAARKVAKGKLTYRYNFTTFTYNPTGFRIENDRLSLSKFDGSGKIRIVLHRQPVDIKQVTVCRKKDGKWYAIVGCQVLRRQYCTIIYKKPVGIDVGITKFAHDSDGKAIDNPQFLTKMLRPVKRAHRRVSRRQIGSNNHRKARHMLARLYERINNKRRDFLHKTSAYYTSRYDLIFLERLRILNMTKNHRLARSILDASWSTFKAMCQYKANRVVEVEPAYSSVACSKCGCKVPKSLAVRTHSCPKCFAVMDRDYNSALNHLQKGLQILQLPVERRECTPVEIPRESEKQEQKKPLPFQGVVVHLL